MDWCGIVAIAILAVGASILVTLEMWLLDTCVRAMLFGEDRNE